MGLLDSFFTGMLTGYMQSSKQKRQFREEFLYDVDQLGPYEYFAFRFTGNGDEKKARLELESGTKELINLLGEKAYLVDFEIERETSSYDKFHAYLLKVKRNY